MHDVDAVAATPILFVAMMLKLTIMNAQLIAVRDAII